MFIQLSPYRYIAHTHFRDVLLIVKVPLKQNINNKHEYAQYVPVLLITFYRQTLLWKSTKRYAQNP